MREVFDLYRPTVVFHAAAYKHVGLMERNPVEAVRNNAIATRLMARIAGQMKVKTLRARLDRQGGRPRDGDGRLQGARRVRARGRAGALPGTRYCAVRFGNVLGSSGSVVPIFRRQIALGGPVTVTDERMTRYFMTIPEAVQLIIRAGGLAAWAPRTGGEIYVLEMGEPVRILDLARTMIELSGLDPDRDIAIEVVGRRPGEKLHEELFNPYERPQPTPAEKILRAEREPRSPQVVDEMFDQIGLLVLEGDAAGLAAKVSELSAIAEVSPTRISPLRAGSAACDLCPIHDPPSTARRRERVGSRCLRGRRSSSRSAPTPGYASIIGLGVMALLYFTQAREVKRLREWAGREPERAAELAQRVQADPPAASSRSRCSPRRPPRSSRRPRRSTRASARPPPGRRPAARPARARRRPPPARAAAGRPRPAAPGAPAALLRSPPPAPLRRRAVAPRRRRPPHAGARRADAAAGRPARRAATATAGARPRRRPPRAGAAAASRSPPSAPIYGNGSVEPGHARVGRRTPGPAPRAAAPARGRRGRRRLSPARIAADRRRWHRRRGGRGRRRAQPDGRRPPPTAQRLRRHAGGAARRRRARARSPAAGSSVVDRADERRAARHERRGAQRHDAHGPGARGRRHGRGEAASRSARSATNADQSVPATMISYTAGQQAGRARGGEDRRRRLRVGAARRRDTTTAAAEADVVVIVGADQIELAPQRERHPDGRLE